MPTETDTTNLTLVSEHGRFGIPCRCGELHTGKYAQEDFLHHECLHRATLIAVDRLSQVICPVCGCSWQVAVGEML